MGDAQAETVAAPPFWHLGRMKTPLLCVLLAACASSQGSAPPRPGAPGPAPGASAPAAAPPPAGAAVRAPGTRREDVVETIHGVAVHDPYRWLEDAGSAEVQGWMQAQDAAARAQLSALPGRAALVERLRQLSYLDVAGVPLQRGSRLFYFRRFARQEKGVVVVREGKDGEERVLLDPNAWSEDGSVSLGRWAPSWDGSRVSFLQRANNSDEATLHVIDVASRKVSAVDVIEGTKYANVAWTPEGDGFYYTWVPTDPAIAQPDRTGYAELRFHKLGADPRRDRLVRSRTGDPRTYLQGELSRDGHWLVASVAHGSTSTDVYFKDARAPRARWTTLTAGSDAHYAVSVWRDRFYIHTNEGAGRWRVLVADPRKPARRAWTEIVPENRDATLDQVSIVGGRLALRYLKDVATRLELRALNGEPVRAIDLPGPGTATVPEGLEDEDEAYFSFTSYLHPPQIISTRVSTGASKVWFKVEVPIDPLPYQVEQVFFASKDGTRVPMFVVHRKDMPHDGSTPTLLTGYGGFEVPILPLFQGAVYAWLERGGAWAVANLRGGSEYGEEWHRRGMLLEKQHVFDDFLGAAGKLFESGVTRPDRLAIRGGSNGGLLVGAAETQRPDLFAAVLCAVPLLDMVRYHRFGQAKTWVPEYGSADDPAQFQALFAYSPYHRLAEGTRYPPTLVLSADADDRVDPLHARKFAAALQAATSGGPVLLRIERHSGHGGADLIRSTVERVADELAFALAHLAAPESRAAQR
ncbi:MAG: prolyl oligopeptidase family serine peptidase [Myxococcales bacterium]